MITPHGPDQTRPDHTAHDQAIRYTIHQDQTTPDTRPDTQHVNAKRYEALVYLVPAIVHTAKGKTSRQNPVNQGPVGVKKVVPV